MKMKRVLVLVLAVTLMIGTSPLQLVANGISYSGSSSYMGGVYYQQLCDVSLTGNQATDIVNVAASQIGYKSGSSNSDLSGSTSSASNVKYSEYGRWYGINPGDWCAMFVSWCARQAGVSTSILPNFAGCTAAYNTTLPNAGCDINSRSSGYVPKAGDLIFFGNSTSDVYHVGIVKSANNSTVYYIDGNNTSTTPHCVHNSSCALSYSSIIGYATPNYSGSDPHACTFSGSYYEAAHPHKVYQQCSCGKTQYVEGETRAYHNCSACMALSWAYVQPVKAYTIKTGKTTVYDSVNGTALSNKIYDTDLCTISEIYDCGWCKVTFPLDAGGTETGYVKIGVFMKSGGDIAYASGNIAAYRRSDLATSAGTVAKGEKIYVLGYTSSAAQVAFPLDAGGYKVGWIANSSIKATVKYNANGGSGTMNNSSMQYRDTFSLAENTFTKTGYTFLGWNVYRSSDKTWYVTGIGWKTATEISDNGYEKKLYADGGSLTFNNTWLSLGKTNETYTFYAVWEPNTLKVYYNANGGVINSDTYKLTNNKIYYVSDGSRHVQTWTYNQTKTNGLVNNGTLGLSREGYTFAGWGTTSTGGTIFGQNDTTVVPTDLNANIKTESCSLTLYAIWEPNELTIYYNVNGGTITSDTYKVSNGLVARKSDNVTALQKMLYNKTNVNGLWNASSFGLSRTGYTFVGWGTTSTGGTVFDQNDATLLPQTIHSGLKTADRSVTLYAIWKKDPTTTTTSTTTTTTTAAPNVKGDINKDDKVALSDAMQAFYHVSAKSLLTGDEYAIADIDGDGNVTIRDAMQIFYFVSGKTDNL